MVAGLVLEPTNGSMSLLAGGIAGAVLGFFQGIVIDLYWRWRYSAFVWAICMSLAGAAAVVLFGSCAVTEGMEPLGCEALVFLVMAAGALLARHASFPEQRLYVSSRNGILLLAALVLPAPCLVTAGFAIGNPRIVPLLGAAISLLAPRIELAFLLPLAPKPKQRPDSG